MNINVSDSYQLMAELYSEFCNADGIKKILSYYDKIMILKIFVDDHDELKDRYTRVFIHRNEQLFQDMTFIDAGVDLFAPFSSELSSDTTSKIDYNICCSATIITDTMKEYNTGFYLYPRSSLSKTSLRLANSVGIIDAGYRGHIMGMFDSNKNYIVEENSRQLQICAPGLIPIIPIVVDCKEELGQVTQRGSGGFGSSGI
jgi:dUTP pyrophosphatase